VPLIVLGNEAWKPAVVTIVWSAEYMCHVLLCRV